MMALTGEQPCIYTKSPLLSDILKQLDKYDNDCEKSPVSTYGAMTVTDNWWRIVLNDVILYPSWMGYKLWYKELTFQIDMSE